MSPTGNHSSCTANRMISINPNQNEGAAKHSKARPVITVSHTVPTPSAARMPGAHAHVNAAIDSPVSISSNVAGSRSPIAEITVWFCR